MIYAYIRVSTDHQDVENQRSELLRWAEKDGFKIDKWVSEEKSGVADWTQRKLKTILKNAKQGDIVISSEISRLARRFLMLMEILSICQKNGVEVWTRKGDFRLGNNVQSKCLAFAFGIAAEIERDLISQRTKDALKKRKEEGVKLGRPFGCKLDKYKEEIENGIREYGDVKRMCRRFNCCRSTLTNFIKRNNLNHPRLLGKPKREKL
ncbi:MAG: recombinase family protein [Opitutales bacterium]|nr:recombinase family protein [Opitutales bacterium]